MTVLHAGEIGRLDLITSLLDTDEITILSNGALFRITTAEAKNYFSSNINVTEITFADSPYEALTSDEVIAVDATDGEIIIILFPLVKGETIEIKKKDSSANKVKYQGNGFNIDGLAEREISTQYNSDRLIGESTEWGRW